MNNRFAFTSISLCIFLFPISSVVSHKSFRARVTNQQKSCQPPDIPIGGGYRRVVDGNGKQTKDDLEQFLPGDSIEYFCEHRYLLTGKIKRLCMSSGIWSESTPFCERPAGVKNLSFGTMSVDGNIDTCRKWSSKLSNKAVISLKEKAVIKTIKFFVQGSTSSKDDGYIDFRISMPYDEPKSPEEKPIRRPSSSKNVTSMTEDPCEYGTRGCGSNNRGRREKLKEHICGQLRMSTSSSRWITVDCKDGGPVTDELIITDISGSANSLTVCEVQIYTKTEFSCDSPPNITVANGHFNISRSRAILVCDEGYKAQNNRLVCEGHEWKGNDLRCEEILCKTFVGNRSQTGGEWVLIDEVKQISSGTRMRLKCQEGYRLSGQPITIECLKNGTWTATTARCEENSNPRKRVIVIATVAVVVVLIILFLLGLAIFLIHKQKAREVVVVFKPGADGSTTANSELEYAGCYESIQGPPIPPSTPRPTIPTTKTGKEYFVPADFKYSPERQQRTPADIAFGTLKQSSIYGS